MKFSLDLREVLYGYRYDIPNDIFIKIDNTERKLKHKLNWWNKESDEEQLIAEEIPEREARKLTEGAAKQIWVNVYERDPQARKDCLDFYSEPDGRIKCWVCKMNFAEDYDESMAGKIHIHHRKPLHEIGQEYQVDPIKDLLPVCPNCHYAIHVLGLSPEELKKRLENKKSQ
jgi:5-methylcytosine-specific restriction enzyme A